MDQQLVAHKLESLRRCVRRVETKCPEQAEVLFDDYDIQDILTLNLTRAVQRCVDIAVHVVASSEEPPPDTLAERMKGAVGFRNVAIHNYREIDWQIVFTVCRERVEDFRQFAGAVHRAVLERT